MFISKISGYLFKIKRGSRTIPKKLRKVNRKTKFLYIDKIRVENLDFLQFFPDVEEVRIDSYSVKDIKGLKSLKKLKKLTIYRNSIRNFRVLKKIGTLTFLELDVRYFNDFNFKILRKIKNLKSLVLYSDKNFNDTKFLKGLTGLEYLNISRITNGDHISRLKNLKKLELGFINEEINYEFLNCLTNLEQLNLFSCDGFDFENITNLKKLRGFKMDATDAKNYDKIKNLQSLKYITIERATDPDINDCELPGGIKYIDFNISAIESTRLLKKFKNLNYVSFYRCEKLQCPDDCTDIEKIAILSKTSGGFRHYDIKYVFSYSKYLKNKNYYRKPKVFVPYNRYATDKNGSVIALRVWLDEDTVPSVVSELNKLKYLLITKSNLKSIENIAKLDLVYVDFSENTLRDKDLAVLPPNVRHLYLRKNIITSLEGLYHLKGLKVLDISENPIKDFKELAFFTNLTHLFISKDQIKNLQTICELPNLKKLYVRYNFISYEIISGKEEICRFVSKHIRASVNEVKISELQQLEVFCFDNNLPLNRVYHLWQIYSYRDDTLVSYMSNKEGSVFLVDFYKVKLPGIPEFLKNFKNLKHLAFVDSKIESLSVLRDLKHLKELSLSSLGLREIPDLFDFSDLTYLDLSNNPIKDLRSLEKLTKLEKLNISRTQINSVEPITKLNLRFLDISYTNIKDVSKIGKIRTLEKLEAREANLKDVDFLSDLHKLEAVELMFNQITNIDFLKKMKNLIHYGVIWKNPIKDFYPLYYWHLANKKSGTTIKKVTKYFIPHPFNKIEIDTLLFDYYWILSDKSLFFGFIDFYYTLLKDLNIEGYIPDSHGFIYEVSRYDFIKFLTKEKIERYTRSFPFEIFFYDVVTLLLGSYYKDEVLKEIYKKNPNLKLCAKDENDLPYKIKDKESYCRECRFFNPDEINCPVFKKSMPWFEEEDVDIADVGEDEEEDVVVEVEEKPLKIEKNDEPLSLIGRLDVVHSVYDEIKDKVHNIIDDYECMFENCN